VASVSNLLSMAYREATVFTIILTILGFITLFSSILLISSLINTYYVLGENELYIRYGVYYKLRIPYKNIISVNPKRNWSAIQTLGHSADNLVIQYNNSGKKYFDKIIYISPETKEEFIRQLNEHIAGETS